MKRDVRGEKRKNIKGKIKKVKKEEEEASRQERILCTLKKIVLSLLSTILT